MLISLVDYNQSFFLLFLELHFSNGVEWKNDDLCGLSYTNRIIGGKLVSDGQYPWLARLGYTTKIKGRYVYLCGGALVNKKFVITAAHCLQNNENKM